MKITRTTSYPDIIFAEFYPSEIRNDVILCAINTRDLSKNMVRVRSSNMWGYSMNIRKNGDRVGDLLVQFKGKEGGPGDIYILYDVPITLFRKFVSAPSKGHFYYQHFRNNFYYSKLTGSKKGMLPNAIN